MLEKCYLVRDRRVLILVVATIVLSMTAMTAMAALAAAQTTGGISREAHFEIVNALRDEIMLLKWIGGGIIGALATTVALLFRALEKSRDSRGDDLVEGIKRREALIVDVLGSNAELKEQIGDLVQEYREQRGA